MPQPAHATAASAHPTHMDHIADPHPVAPAPATAAGRPRMRDQAADNPLLTLFGGMIIALLISTLASSNLRIGDINGRLNDMNDHITRLEVKIDAQDDKIHQIDLKLTALIAALNKTDEVEAALSGTIISGESATRDGAGNTP